MSLRLPLILVIIAIRVCGQDGAAPSPILQQILERLDSLEKENKELVREVQSLRQELAASRPATPAAIPDSSKPDQPTLEERVSVEERRTAEQAQTKLEAAHKFPIRLDGMLLFNAFANSSTKDTEYLDQGNLLTGPNRDGATLRQTLLGLDFDGPHLPGDGRVNGFISMDFYGGDSDPGYTMLTLRRAGISFDWKNRSFSIGQDKPLISQYQPDSLAEVGIPPLAGAGNLWLWLPQARYEERISLGANTGFKGQLSLMQTQEAYAIVPADLASVLEQARPALEGRFAFWHKRDSTTRRFEFAPGFHVSTTRIGGASVGSHIASLNWLIGPDSHLEISGTFFTGKNIASLGALGNGFTITPIGSVQPVNSTGGWFQLAFPVTSRLRFNVYSGLENDHSAFLSASSVTRDWTYAGNFMYHLGPNVVVSVEALQMRTRSFAGMEGLHNHYDLALGYLF